VKKKAVKVKKEGEERAPLKGKGAHIPFFLVVRVSGAHDVDSIFTTKS
jgi:hypothetical protein